MLHLMLSLVRPIRSRSTGRHVVAPTVLAVTAVLCAPVQAATPTSTAASSPDVSSSSAVALRSVGGQMLEAEVPLPAHPVVRTLRTGPVSMVAATWSGADEPVVEVATRRGAGWTRWRTLSVLEDGPTPGNSESNERRGTDLAWITQVDEVRVRTSGAVPDDLALVLMDTTGTTSRRAADARRGPDHARVSASPSNAAQKRPDAAPRPRIRSRSRWGANEKWRGSDPIHNRRIRQIHIHHTATSNDYSRADVPGIIRGMYRYHTKSLKWSDIGYNVLVDRFGRAWSGRFNGPRSRVRGAHTLGFNRNSTGVAVIGDYTDQSPGRAVVRVLSRISAWQLDRHGSKAIGKVRMKSQGSDLYGKGRAVRLPVIDGHRTTNQTACPGDRLMKVLPTIRKNAQGRIERY